ncbi:hypothetical protein P7C73_g4384, partial [Tremellales sp. Uapishka_1]
MRFTIVLTFILPLFTLVRAAPVLTERDATSNSVASAVPITSTLASRVSAIIARVEADPLTTLSVYTGDGGNEYNIQTQLESAFGAALSGIESLPSLPKSTNPSQTILNDYGPLVKVVTSSLLYSLIDLKLLSQAVIDLPEYTAFTQSLDANSFAYTKALDAQYTGLVDELATAVGANPPLGEALKSIGGETFYLLFDHISATK